MRPLERVAIVAAGVLGASGVGAAAASSHAGAELLGPYALVALTHAPAILAIAMARLPRIFDGALIALVAGALLFCAELAARHFLGHALLPLAAPLGGVAMILGWAMVIVGGLFSRRD